ncbi:hypothetical protein ACFYYS_17910 [Streptomyces sp. NPDC002120]
MNEGSAFLIDPGTAQLAATAGPRLNWIGSDELSYRRPDALR